MRVQWIAVLVLSITFGVLMPDVQAAEIHDVIKAGDIDRLSELLRGDVAAELIRSQARGGSTPLRWAAVHGVPQAARLLIEHGADVNATTENGSTPLHWAANRDSLPVARLLLEQGADVNAASSKRYSPLHWAAIGNAPSVTALLIESGADVNATGLDGITPLHWATRKLCRSFKFCSALKPSRTSNPATAPRRSIGSRAPRPVSCSRIQSKNLSRPSLRLPPSRRLSHLLRWTHH